MNENRPEFVVGLGASAGGLEALERFFDSAPKDSGGAFIVVMHLSKDFVSMLGELLARHTDMPVLPALDNEVLRANTVYVIQPANVLELRGDRFHVTNRPILDQGGAATTIDTFFQSLAGQWKNKCGAVVLSGSGSDGAVGVLSIRQYGGFTCAQAPETAKFDSMPLAAITTNAIQAVEPPEELATTVIEGIQVTNLNLGVKTVTEHESALARILKAVMGVSKVEVARYKHSTFERRVRRRMMDLNTNSLSTYATLVEGDETEARALGDALLIGVTQFFRDAEAFNSLSNTVVPELIAQAEKTGEPIRIWVAGCATGEEAYSLSIAITDAMAGMPNRIEVQIFATDIKREYLNFAGRGEFGAESLESVPERLRNKYFKPIHQTDRYAIDPAVRKSIVFAPHDVLSDPPFTRLDLISCRNLLIYFSVEGQQKVLNSFAFGLKERGILFLGSSETVGAHREAFDFIDARNRIFRRTTSKRTLPSTMRDRGREARETIDQNTAIARLSVRTREAALIPAYASLLADYAPPGLLISEQRELLHSFGDARRFLRPPAGVAHLDSTEMVDSAIRTPILAGLERALRQKQPVTFNRIELAEFPAAGTIVDVTIRPITISGQQDPHHALIIIDDSRYSATQRETGESGLILDPDGLTAERIDELEAELDRTREALQSTIQEIETTNEELQASNEELMSSNEELQSTNEELSSVNEELYSVNSEYHRQNDELTRLNADFDLLLQSTEIGVIFLDRELCITRYTSLAGTLFALQDADIGRPIGNFRSPFEDLEPEALLQASEVDAQIVEREARDAAGDTWLIRAVAHDHRRVSVLTIINIGRLRNAELAARRTGDMLTAIQSMANAMYFELDAECRYATSTLGLEDYFDSNEDTSAQPLSLDALFLTDQNLLVDAIRAADPGTEVTAVAPLRNPTGDELRFVSFKAKPTEQGSWRVTGVDVDEYVRTQSRNREQQAILEAMMRASKSQLSFVDADERYRYANPAFERQAGRSIDQILGKKVSEVLPSDAYKDAGAYIRAALQGNRQEYLSTHDLDDGSQQTVSNVYEPVLGDGSQVDGFVADSLDISEYLTAAKELSVQDRLLARAAKFSQTPTLLVDTASGIVEYANSKAQMLLGDTPAVRSNFLISRLSPDWGNNRWVDWLDKLPIGGYDLRRDMLIFSSSGQPQTADVSVTVVADAGAKKAKVRVHDDAERVLMLKDLQERSRELAISNRDLETFASIIAHDLRAPLRHINQFTSLLEEALEAGNSHEANEHAAVIQGSIEAMFGMVDGLLQYAKIGQSVAPFTPIALSETLEAVRKRLESDIGKADAVLVIDTDLPDVAGDKALLEELFQNLISNALKYAKPDQPPEIRIAAQSTDDGVAVVVEDNGVGIDSRYAERVFRLFHRLQPEAEADGLGIGLAACRRIAELHNGNVVLDSDYSGGCRFVVTLGGS